MMHGKIGNKINEIDSDIIDFNNRKNAILENKYGWN